MPTEEECTETADLVSAILDPENERGVAETVEGETTRNGNADDPLTELSTARRLRRRHVAGGGFEPPTFGL
jgi:hypothetical protein